MAKRIKISFLGGVGEIGKNITCIEHGEDIIVVDAGLTFPDNEETPGIEYIIPDYTYLLNNRSKIKGIFITHGHEDHIGALPFLLKDIKAPVYGSPLALGILESKLKEFKVEDYTLYPVEDRDVIPAGKMSVEFIRVTHSIAGSYALAIWTPKGTIFMTGDFKIDHTPIDGRATDLTRIAQIGEEGVLLLMADSTNVEKPGYSMSESNVFKALDNLFVQNKDKRIIVATFASNVHRVQQIINCAVSHDRKVAFAGRSLQKIAEIALDLGELHYPEDAVIDIDKIGKYDLDKQCVICTGTQGEPMSALTRMSENEFPKLEVGDYDTVLMSSSAIPGNEKTIFAVINNLNKRGAEVVYHALAEIHSSGHACREELKLIFSLLKPSYFIPVHGEYRHLKMHKELAMEMGMGANRIFIAQNGNSVEVDSTGIRVGCNVPCGQTLFDGKYLVEDVNGLIGDRKALASSGCVIATVFVNPETYRDPVIVTRGINLPDEVRAEITDELITEIQSGKLMEAGLDGAKQYVRKFLAKKIQKRLDKRPVIVPIVFE